MNKLRIKNILKLLLVTQFFFAEVLYANTLPYVFTNSQSIYLRDQNLANPQTIGAGSRINVDPQFLLRNLGTATPSQEQMQRLLLNPGEASRGRITTKPFRNPRSNRVLNDYFFPVIVTSADGQVKTGQIALNSYARLGAVSLIRTDGKDPRTFQTRETTTQLRDFVEYNKRSNTEAAACSACTAPPPVAPTQPLSDVVRALEQDPTIANDQLWNRYVEFAREFNRANPNITRARAGYYKRLYLSSLVQRFGAADAGRILASVTGFAEAPHRSANETQIAEIAAVIKVIQNRANARFRTTARALRDAGIPQNADMQLTNILADWQFSAWNDRDPNLIRMLTFTPERAEAGSRRKMMLAFEAQSMMASGRVQFIGRMNDPRMLHYHANYVNPSWDRTANRLVDAAVRVDNVTVDITRQRGPRHIFYVGIN